MAAALNLFFPSTDFFSGPGLGSLSLLELLQCDLPELSYGYGFDDVSKELHQDIVPARMAIWGSLQDEVMRFEENVVRPLSTKLESSYGMMLEKHGVEVNNRRHVGSLLGHILLNAPDVASSSVPLPWGCADLCLCSGGRPLVVGLVEADYNFPEMLTAKKFVSAIGEESEHGNLLRQLVLRLYSYMKLNSLAYGFITTWQNTWFVSVEQESLAISEPVSRTQQPLMKFWYLVDQALKPSSSRVKRNINMEVETCALFRTSIDAPVELISTLVQDELTRVSSDWKVGIYPEVLSQVQVWRDSFQSLQLLAWKPMREGSPMFNHSLFKVKYNGQDAVLKVTDLSMGDSEWQGMAEFAREVQAYKMLHSLQGRVIPHLLAHGVVDGTMLAFVITSFEGTGANQRFQSVDTLVALESVHGLGVGLGEIRAGNFLIGPDGKIRIVGFSNAFFFHPSSRDTLDLVRIREETSIVTPPPPDLFYLV